MRAIFTFALAVVLAFSVAPRQAAAASRFHIIATTTDIQALITAVAGDKVEVESLAAPAQDPHSLELKPSQLMRLRSAALLVRIGLDHEPWLARAQFTAPVLNLSESVRLLQTETPRLRVERQSHVHAFGNPHYWLDPENAKAMAIRLSQALGKLIPAERAYFDANRDSFIKQVDERMAAWKKALAPYAGARIVVVHDTWIYFADRFNLSIVAAAEGTPGVPPSPAELARLYSRMREAGVRLVVADPNSSDSLVRQVAEHGNARIVALIPSVGADPAARDYLSLIDLNVDRLVKALR
jgi:zinc/manganese transport system substrate-binding protein